MHRYDEYKKHLWTGEQEPDDISRSLFQNAHDIFDTDPEEVDRWRLASARDRFHTLMEKIPALRRQAEAAQVSELASLSDIVPLLFQHIQYKSYPLSLLEKGRYDRLTQWLDGLTSLDLSSIDASQCSSIDDWLALLEQQTIMVPYHTSGTTGKLSFYPRTAMERDFIVLGTVKWFELQAGQDKQNLGFDGIRVPLIFPSWRNGRYAGQRMVQFFSKHFAPQPEQCFTLTNGTLSADLMSLSGRIRVAQAKGELDKMELSEPMRVAFRRYLQELENQPAEVDAFMNNKMEELRGQQVFIFQTTNYLIQAAREGLGRGIRDVFDPNSFGLTGGGGKGVVLPDNWQEMIADFTGISSWLIGYGMTEMNGSMPLCDSGYYHIPPYYIPFLLDPESGDELPRSGVQTGRFAFLDLLAETYWGGIVTGDKVTIEWDRQCPCGKKGAHIHNSVTRYSEEVTGDDKVTCSATIDNTDAALQALINSQ
jgi:hypothetical protein